MQKINNYFNKPKKLKLDEETETCTTVAMEKDHSQPSSSSVTSSSFNEDIGQGNKQWPDCWSLEQKNEFCKKYSWLIVQNKKLGCKVCSNVGYLGSEKTCGMKMSKQWTQCEITSFGETRAQQLTALRKKIYDHKDSAAHLAALKISSEAKKETMEKLCLKTLSKEKEVTARIFRTAYKVAKQNQSFNDFETEIDVQELNGLNMGRILHSNKACANIINHISAEMRKHIVQEIIKSTDKFAIMIDESTTLSKKSTLILYIRVCLKDLGMESPVNLFLDLIELENVTSLAIFQAVIQCLEGYNLNDNVMANRLIAVSCDGAAVMLGRKSGVCALLKERFPSIIVWHCSNHRLELCVNDVVKKMATINRFKAFIDKLYVLYHASPKNSRDLHLVADELGVQLLKIGRVLDTRWVASSFRTVSAIWENYEILANHFMVAKEDQTRDSSDRCKYEGLLRKLTSSAFVLDLALMCDSLQELSEVSEELQHRDVDLFRANKKLKILANTFVARKNSPGTFYEQAVTSVNNKMFMGVQLYEKSNEQPIDPAVFYENLSRSIENRMLSGEDAALAMSARILDPSTWPNDIKDNTFGEKEIESLAVRFQLNRRDTIKSFREYVFDNCEHLGGNPGNKMKYSKDLLLLTTALQTIPVSSSECERGFSQMNLIMTHSRASLSVETISALLFLKLNGPPLTRFEPSKYVESWLLRGRHSALDMNSKAREREGTYNKNMCKLWTVL